jgi:outer membrane autotransporter protein
MTFDYERDDREGGTPVKGSGDGLAGAFNMAVGGNVAEGFVLAGLLLSNSIAEPQSRDATINGYSVASESKPRELGKTDLGGLGLLADWYIDPKGGWHVMGALFLAGLNGAGSRKIGVDYDDGTTVFERADSERQSGGFGAMIGGGYEWWIGEQWSLGPIVQLAYASTQSQKQDWKHTVLAAPTVLLGITYH